MGACSQSGQAKAGTMACGRMEVTPKAIGPGQITRTGWEVECISIWEDGGGITLGVSMFLPVWWASSCALSNTPPNICMSHASRWPPEEPFIGSSNS